LTLRGVGALGTLASKRAAPATVCLCNLSHLSHQSHESAIPHMKFECIKDIMGVWWRCSNNWFLNRLLTNDSNGQSLQSTPLATYTGSHAWSRSFAHYTALIGIHSEFLQIPKSPNLSTRKYGVNVEAGFWREWQK
jgi:hypothetical protein